MSTREAAGKGEIFGKLLLSVGAIAVTLIALEIAVRLNVRERRYSYPAGMFVLDPETRHRLAPNFSGILQYNEFETQVHTNGLGMRDVESNRPQSGRTRILVMGDSYTFGHGVEGKESFPKRLESLLNEGNPGRVVEVLNGGVPGYSTVQEVRLLRRLLPKIQPDIVIIAFYSGNDLEFNDLSITFDQSGLGLVDGEIVERESEPDSHFHRVKMVLARYSSLYRFITRRIHASPTLGRLAYRTGLSTQDYQLPFKIEQFSRVPTARVEDRWRDTETVLHTFQSLCARQRCIPLIATIPDGVQYDEDLWARFIHEYGLDPHAYDPDIVRRRLSDVADKLSIGVIDLSSSLANHSRTAPLHHARDGHWNAHGHAVAARGLAEFLKRDVARLQQEAKK